MPPEPPRRISERILETALAMFNQFGEPTAATTSIAFELGISLGNLDYHCHSKEHQRSRRPLSGQMRAEPTGFSTLAENMVRAERRPPLQRSEERRA